MQTVSWRGGTSIRQASFLPQVDADCAPHFRVCRSAAASSTACRTCKCAYSGADAAPAPPAAATLRRYADGQACRRLTDAGRLRSGLQTARIRKRGCDTGCVHRHCDQRPFDLHLRCLRGRLDTMDIRAQCQQKFHIHLVGLLGHRGARLRIFVCDVAPTWPAPALTCDPHAAPPLCAEEHDNRGIRRYQPCFSRRPDPRVRVFGTIHWQSPPAVF